MSQPTRYDGYRIAPEHFMGDTTTLMAWASSIRTEVERRTCEDIDQAIIDRAYAMADLLILRDMGLAAPFAAEETLNRPNFSCYVHAGHHVSSYTSNHESGAARNETKVSLRLYFQEGDQGTNTYIVVPLIDMPHIDPEEYISDIFSASSVVEEYNWRDTDPPFDVSANAWAARQKGWESLRGKYGARRDPDLVIPLLDVARLCQHRRVQVYTPELARQHIQTHTPPSWLDRWRAIEKHVSIEKTTLLGGNGLSISMEGPPSMLIDNNAIAERIAYLKTILDDRYSSDLLLGNRQTIEAHIQNKIIGLEVETHLDDQYQPLSRPGSKM